MDEVMDEVMDEEIREIQRLAGMLKEKEYCLGSDEAHMDKVRRLIGAAEQANQGGDVGQVGYILRELYKLIQEHEDSEIGNDPSLEPGARQTSAMGL